MKKTLSFFLALILMLSINLTVRAQESNERIYDQAELLSQSEESELSAHIGKLKEQYPLDIAIVTVDSLDGKSVRRYADDFYYDHFLGVGTDDSGILFLIAMDSREWSVTTYGDTADVVTNVDIDDIMDILLDDLSDGDYYDTFDGFLDEIEDEYRAYKTAKETAWLKRLLIALIIGAVIAGIALFIMRRKMNTARAQHGAGSYMKDGSYDLYRCRDIYLYSRTSRIRKAENNSSGGHRGGGSRGGRSGRF